MKEISMKMTKQGIAVFAAAAMVLSSTAGTGTEFIYLSKLFSHCIA